MKFHWVRDPLGATENSEILLECAVELYRNHDISLENQESYDTGFVVKFYCTSVISKNAMTFRYAEGYCRSKHGNIRVVLGGICS